MANDRSMGEISVSTVAELIAILKQLPGEASVSNQYGEELVICPTASTVMSKISDVEFS